MFDNLIAATPLARRLLRVGYYGAVDDFMKDPENFLEVEGFPETVQMFVECGECLGIPFWNEAKSTNRELDAFIELCAKFHVTTPEGFGDDNE